jgi:hypothetical protein
MLLPTVQQDTVNLRTKSRRPKKNIEFETDVTASGSSECWGYSNKRAAERS